MIDPRVLKRHLDTYRLCGVQEVTLGEDMQPTSIRFAAMSPLPLGEVEGDTGDLELPPGVTNVAAELARIRAAYPPQPRKVRAQ